MWCLIYTLGYLIPIVGGMYNIIPYDMVAWLYLGLIYLLSYSTFITHLIIFYSSFLPITAIRVIISLCTLLVKTYYEDLLFRYTLHRFFDDLLLRCNILWIKKNKTFINLVLSSMVFGMCSTSWFPAISIMYFIPSMISYFFIGYIYGMIEKAKERYTQIDTAVAWGLTCGMHAMHNVFMHFYTAFLLYPVSPLFIYLTCTHFVIVYISYAVLYYDTLYRNKNFIGFSPSLSVDYIHLSYHTLSINRITINYNEEKLQAINFPAKYIPREYICPITLAIMNVPVYIPGTRAGFEENSINDLRLINPEATNPLTRGDNLHLMVKYDELKNNIELFILKAQFLYRMYGKNVETQYSRFQTQLQDKDISYKKFCDTVCAELPIIPTTHAKSMFSWK